MVSSNSLFFMRFAVISIFILFFSGCATKNISENDLKFTALVERASSEYDAGLLTEAEASYRELTKLRPDYYEPWLKLGNIYVRTGQLEAAVRMFTECTNLRPDDVRGWSNLSLTRLKQSLAVLNQAQQYFPKDSSDAAVLGAAKKSLINHLVK